MKHFTMLWAQPTWQRLKKQGLTGQHMMHVASDQFSTRRVVEGDRIFTLGTREGGVLLIGALTAGSIVSRQEVRRELGFEPWDADEHILAQPGSGTRIEFDDLLPLTLLSALEFTSAGAIRGLIFREPGRVDQQTLRGIRQLTTPSAELLEEHLSYRSQLKS